MHSCATGSEGKDGKSFAEKLSGKHENLLVIAPTEKVWMGENKESVGKSSNSENGQWKVFYKGKTLGTISGKNNTLKEILSSEKPVEKLLITMVLPEVSKLLNK